MFYDLNIPWSPQDPHLARTLAFAHELGYNVVALNHILPSAKLPAEIKNPIPTPLPFAPPPGLKVLTRVTLPLTAPVQNARLAALGRAYDVLAIAPVDEKTLALACRTLDCDVIALDLSVRWPFYFAAPMLGEAVRAGKKLEMAYGAALQPGGGAAEARRLVVQNATQLVRATKGGRGVVVCSGAGVRSLRAPWDVVNLAGVWGLSRERALEAVGREARGLVVAAGLRRSSYRGVVDVVFGGERVEQGEGDGDEKGAEKKSKRKAGEAGMDSHDGQNKPEEPLSKTQMRKRAKQAKLEAVKAASAGESPRAASSKTL
nr:putative ribonuclease p protein subunit 3 [Quercus suber]